MKSISKVGHGVYPRAGETDESKQTLHAEGKPVCLSIFFAQFSSTHYVEASDGLEWTKIVIV